LNRVLLDTSVLVAALVELHPQHAIALPWLARGRARQVALFVAAHSLAECFSTLTSLPIRPPIGADRAHRLIEHDILGQARARLVPLSGADYRAVISGVAGRGLRGGIVYDALIARAAEKVEARLVTFNARHFGRLVADPARRLLDPAS
jgi:predicted nucleic acid-binding protein